MVDNHFVSSETLKRHKLLTLVSENMITLKDVSEDLNLSYRHTKRLFKRFIKGNRSLESLLHKRTHPAWNKLNLEAKKAILAMQNEYPDANNCHLASLLRNLCDITVHPSTVRSILIRAGRYEADAKRTRPRKRFEKSAFGELIQIDTSEHLWLPSLNKPTYLVLMEDDYSRFILSAAIFEHDTSWNAMKVIRSAVEKYGIFEILYCDNDSMFKLIRSGYSRHFEYKVDLEKVQTQIHRACFELGIILLPHPPGEPQCKGKIERLFAFLQDRFIIEAKGCKDLKELNKKLQEFIRWYNSSHVHSITGVIPEKRLTPNVCKPLPQDINLDDIFCFKDTRVVKNDNTFEYQGKTYQITNLNTRANYAKAQVELHMLPGKYIRVFYKGGLVQQFRYK